MPLRSPLRILLHLLLAVSLVYSGIVAPAQAIQGQFQAAKAASMAMAMASADMPCDGMAMDSAAEGAPCGCCPAQACDLSECMGMAACLPAFPRLAASAPLTAARVPWQQPALPAGVIEAPLRPPIA